MAEEKKFGLPVSNKPDQSLIYKAPIGTSLPAAGEPLSEEYVSIGYIATEGFTLAPGIEEGDDLTIYADYVVGKQKPTKDPRLSFTFVETGKLENMDLIYHPSDISGEDGNYTIAETDRTPLNKVLVVEYVTWGSSTSDEALVNRVIYPNAFFVEKDDRDFDGTELDAIGVTYGGRRNEDGVFSITQVFIENPEDDGDNGDEGDF